MNKKMLSIIKLFKSSTAEGAVIKTSKELDFCTDNERLLGKELHENFPKYHGTCEIDDLLVIPLDGEDVTYLL